MSGTNTGQMYGFDIPNPPEIPGRGQFINTPTPPMRAITVSEHISTNAIWDHDSGLTHYWGNHWLDKVSIFTLDFQWESVADLKAEDTPIAQEVTVTEGNVTTDTDTTSFTKSIGAEGGGEGKGLSLKVSASLSKTTTQEHSVSISQAVETKRTFECAANHTLQAWQLVATFSHTETIPPFDTGHSIDRFDPPYYAGTRTLVIRTPRWIINTFAG